MLSRSRIVRSTIRKYFSVVGWKCRSFSPIVWNLKHVAISQLISSMFVIFYFQQGFSWFLTSIWWELSEDSREKRGCVQVSFFLFMLSHNDKAITYFLLILTINVIIFIEKNPSDWKIVLPGSIWSSSERRRQERKGMLLLQHLVPRSWSQSSIDQLQRPQVSHWSLSYDYWYFLQ